MQVYGHGHYNFLWGSFQIHNLIDHKTFCIQIPSFPCDKPALDPDCPDVAVIAEVYKLLKLV